jgi:hypothetical protein
MKRTPLQISAYWQVPTTTDTLLPRLDSILRDAGFSVCSTADQARNGARNRVAAIEILGWARVSLGSEKTFFSLYPSRDGPWISLLVRTRRRQSVVVFENVFRDLVEQLRPHEVALRVSSAFDLPVSAQEWCRGGLCANVNCDVEPPVTVRPGDPEWFREVGVERRFISRRLLAKQSVDPSAFAAQTRRICSRMSGGYVFDGGWDAIWHDSGRRSCPGAL